MAEYYIDNETYEVDRDLEWAIIKKYLEKRFISSIVILSFIVGFLLGSLAHVL